MVQMKPSPYVFYAAVQFYAAVDGASRTRHDELRAYHMKTVKPQP